MAAGGGAVGKTARGGRVQPIGVLLVLGTVAVGLVVLLLGGGPRCGGPRLAIVGRANGARSDATPVRGVLPPSTSKHPSSPRAQRRGRRFLVRASRACVTTRGGARRAAGRQHRL